MHNDFLPKIFNGITNIFGSTRSILTAPIFALTNEKHEVLTKESLQICKVNDFAYGKALYFLTHEHGILPPLPGNELR